MNGYEVSLEHSKSVCCVCLVNFNVIQSYLPNYRTTNNEGTYVLLTPNLYFYIITFVTFELEKMHQEAAGSSSCLICRSLIAVRSSKATEVSCMLFLCVAGQTGE